jgi:hypothetical protein
MSLKKLVETQVKNAFNLIGDLKDSFVFSREAKSFNSNTLQNETVGINSITISGICLERRDKKGYYAELIIQSDSLTDVVQYTTVSGLGRSWKIVPPVVDDGYIKTISLQEVASRGG